MKRKYKIAIIVMTFCTAVCAVVINTFASAVVLGVSLAVMINCIENL